MMTINEHIERLELAMLGSDAGLWDWNIETGDVYFNERWCAMLGYHIDEVEPNISSWEKLVHPDDMPLVMSILNQHLEGNTKQYQTEHRVKTKSGEWKWVLDTGKVTQRDDQGKALRAVGTHIDINERKQAEAIDKIELDLGLKLSKAKNLEETMRICLKAAMIYSNMDSGGIYIVNEDNSIRLIEHKGLTDEFIQKTTYYPSDSQNSKLILKGEPIYSNHARLVSENTIPLNVELRKAIAIIPVLHYSRVVGCLNLASSTLEKVPSDSQMILERIATYIGSFILDAKKEDELNQNRQDLKTLFNTVDDFLFILDMEGNMQYFNSTVINRLGYTEDELLNQHVLKVHPSHRHEEAMRIITDMLKGIEKTCPVPLKCKDGYEIPVETKVIEGTWNGKKALIGISRDVSDRKNYESTIKQNAERLEMALFATDAGLWDWNIKTGELIFNNRWCSMRGFKEEEVKMNVSSWKTLLHADDLESTIQALNDHLENKTSFYQAEYRTKTKHDNYIWIQDTGKITEFNEDGTPARMVGTNIDITSKKVSEFKLQMHLRQQELLSEIALELNLPDGFNKHIDSILSKIGLHTGVSRVYIFEDIENGLASSNTYEWCNDAITPQKDELSYIPYDLIPSWKELLEKDCRVYSEDISDLPEDLRKILEPQEIKSIIVYPLYVRGAFFGFMGFDECVRHKKWAKSELELLRTVSGIIANAFERMLSEKSLKESEEKYSSIVNNANDGIYLRKLDGTIIFANKKFAEIHEYPLDEIIGKKSWDFLHPDSVKRMKENKSIDQVQSGAQTQSEDIGLTKSGKSVYLDIRTGPLMSQGEITGIFGIVRNITELKEHEKQITEERDKANQANKSKSEFLANMSHEIRTPMNAILGFSEALYHNLESPQDKKMLKSVLSSGNLLLSLLNDILDLSKIEAGKLDIVPQPVDLKSVLQEIKLLFADKATKKEIEVNLHISSEFPDVLIVDEIRLKQVIFNLVGNAIKFTNEGNVQITISFSKIESKAGTLKLQVKDTGIGIAESQQQIIFEAFQQQSGQSNRKYGGVGLGLAIAKRLVERMGGSIGVESTEGKGSTFTVIIPNVEFYSASSRGGQIKEEEKKIVFENLSLLVVDDVESNIEAIKALASPHGLKIIPALSGMSALEILNHTTPDLILMDLRMPEMDGFETAKRIKKFPGKENIPILAFTASIFNSEKIQLSACFSGIILKPANWAELTKHFIKHLKHTVVSPPNSISNKVIPPVISLTESNKKQLPEIENKLIELFLPKWNSIKDSFVLFSIDAFALELKEMGELYNLSLIIDYANQLREDVDLVDLESLNESLRLFPSIIDKIKQMRTA